MTNTTPTQDSAVQETNEVSQVAEKIARELWVAIIVECPECPDVVGSMDAFQDFWDAESHVNDRTDQLPDTKWEIFKAVEYTKAGQAFGYLRALEEVEKVVMDSLEKWHDEEIWSPNDIKLLITNLKAKGGA